MADVESWLDAVPRRKRRNVLDLIWAVPPHIWWPGVCAISVVIGFTFAYWVAL